MPAITTAPSGNGSAIPAQFIPGKNFYKSGAFGPWIVTPEEMGDPTKAHLMTRLNGVEQQHATVDDLCFDIPTLIEYCSTFTQLEAGDVIVTGTTGGVGAYQKPPLWMKPGDTIEVEITNIGVLRNSIVQEDVKTTRPRIVTVSRPAVRPIFDAMEPRLAAAGFDVVPYRSLAAFVADPDAMADADVLSRRATPLARGNGCGRAAAARCHLAVHRHRGLR